MAETSSLNYPRDAAAVRDEIRQLLKSTIADHGSSMDTGGGLGQADLWVQVGGVEYFITVKGPSS